MLVLRLVLVGHIYGQSITITPENSEVNFGDKLSFRIELLLPENMQVLWPISKDTLIKNIEVIHWGKVDTIHHHDGKRFVQLLDVIAFDTGYLVIPPQGFIIFDEQQVRDTIFSDPILLHVNAIELDDSQQIRSIKSIEKAPYTFKEMLPYIMILLGGLAVISAIVFFMRRKRKEGSFFGEKPVILLPPDMEALSALEDLEQQKLWQKGRHKLYYTKISDILRRYIDRRYQVPAMASTSEQVMEILKENLTDSKWIEIFVSDFAIYDMVKFAKHDPMPLENQNVFIHVKDFVMETSIKMSVDVVKETNMEETEDEKTIKGGDDVA